MDIESKFQDYINKFENDYNQSKNINFILVTLGDSNVFHYNSATDYIYLLEFFDNYKTNMTPQQILEVELQEQNRTVGAIYMRNNGKFNLIVKKGF